MKRISVRSLYDHSTEESLKKAFSTEAPLTDLRLRRVYWLLEKKAGFAKELNLEGLLDRVFFDPISEEIRHGFTDFSPQATYVEIRFLAGVTDNIARSATDALMLFSNSKQSWQDFEIEAHSGWELEIVGDYSQAQIEKILFQSIANPLLNDVQIISGKEIQHRNPFENFENFWKVPATDKRELLLFDLDRTVLEK